MYRQLILCPSEDDSLSSFVTKVTREINELGDQFVSVNYTYFKSFKESVANILYKRRK